MKKPFRNTDDWVWTNKAYLQWEQKPGTLWICGKPGSGKSTIARMITDSIAPHLDAWISPIERSEPTETPSVITAIFFYSARLGERATRHDYMLRSILFQILRQHLYVYKEFRSLLDTRLETGRTTWGMVELRRMIELIVTSSAASGRRLCLVLDGFDGSDSLSVSRSMLSEPQASSFIDWLVSLARPFSANSWLRLIVLSRPADNISPTLKQFPTIVVKDHNGEAIAQVAKEGLGRIESSIHDWIRRDSKPSTEARNSPSDSGPDIEGTLQFLRGAILEKLTEPSNKS